MKRRIVAFITLMMMVITALPTNVFAYVGKLEYASTVEGREENYGFVIQNDYIQFTLDKSGLFSFTHPTALANQKGDSAYQKTTNPFQEYAWYYTPVNTKTRQMLTIASADVSFGENGDVIHAVYYFTESAPFEKFTATFRIVKLGRGVTSGLVQTAVQPNWQKLVVEDETDAGTTWGVLADGYFTVRSGHSFPSVTGNDAYSDIHGNMGEWEAKYYKFPYMGRNNLSVQKPDVKGTRNSEFLAPKGETLNMNNFSVGKTGTFGAQTDPDNDIYLINSISELYVDGCTWANPFVAMSSFYEMHVNGYNSIPDDTEYAEHEANMDGYVSYSSEALSMSTYARHIQYNMGIEADGSDRSYISKLWGYRDIIYTAINEINATEADKVTIKESGQRVHILDKNGTKSAYLSDGSMKLEDLELTHGKCIATVYGEVEENAEGDFEFVNNSARFTSTVTATWDNGGYLKIKKDGTILQNGIHLNAPSFKFYKPKDGYENSLQVNPDENGFAFTMNPEGNSAVINIDIPGAAVALEKANANTTGNLIFEGNLSVNTLFDGAELEIEKLGYGLNENNSFKVNGVKASGSMDSSSLIGFKMSKIEGEINTFPDEEAYRFSLELDVFDLFEASAELALGRVNSTGALMPDSLAFSIASDSFGIPMIAPAPIAELTGGGAGVYNMVATANGDYFGLPPILLEGKVKGEFFKLMEGWATVNVGPGKFKGAISDVKFMNVGTNVIDEFSVEMESNAKTYDYLGTTYIGTGVSSQATLSAKFPSTNNDIFVIDNAYTRISAFGGFDNYDSPTKMYVNFGGNSHFNARVQFPSNWWLIGGKRLGGIGTDMALGAQTVIEMGESANAIDSFVSSFENFNVYGGVMGEIYTLLANARIWYIFPNRFDYEIKASWKDLSNWNWGSHGVQLFALRNSASEQIGLMAVDLGMNELETVSLFSASVNETVYELPDNYSSTNDLYITITLNENEDAEAFKNGLSVKVGKTPFNLVWVDEDAEELDPYATARMQMIENKETGERKHIIVANLGQVTDNITVTNASDIDYDLTMQESTPHTTWNAEFIDETDSFKITPDIMFPKDGAKYVIRTYLESELGAADILIDQQEALTGTPYTFSKNGNLAPTGEYFVTSYLMEEITEDFDETHDGVETAHIPIGSIEFGPDPITYTNTVQPSAPTDVTLKATGNEILNTTWKAVDGADGYKIRIYEENVTESKAGYELDIDSLQYGFSYDSEIDTYSLDMALTVGGTNEDGENNTAFKPDKYYKVGISAYKYLTKETIDGKEEKLNPVYSEEVTTEYTHLPEYVPLNIKVKKVVGDEGATDIIPNENGMLEMTTSKNLEGFTISSDNENAQYTVTRMDNNNEITWSHSSTYENGIYEIPQDFDGILMLKIVGAVESNGIKDITTRYMLVYADYTTPIISLDNDVFYADHNGNYTVTGMTEPGASVSWNIVEAESVTADAQGRFTLIGKLQTEQELETGTLVNVLAVDEGENSDTAFAMILLGSSDGSEDDKPTVNRGGGGGVSRYTIKFEANGGTEITKKSVTRNSKLAEPEAPEKEGYTFNGWYTDEELTEKYDFDSKVTKGFTLYAKWDKHDDEMTVTSEWVNPFEDVKNNDWFFEDVKYANQNELMNGVSATEFAPNDNLTRAMLVTVLYRLEGEPRVSGITSFSDLEKGQYYLDAVCWAQINGIVNGVTDTAFAPNDNITREQIAAIMHRYAQYKGYDVSVGENTNILSYDDFDSISEYAIASMQYACGSGLMKGKTASTLNPKDNATRAEIAAILHRFIETNN